MDSYEVLTCDDSSIVAILLPISPSACQMVQAQHSSLIAHQVLAHHDKKIEIVPNPKDAEYESSQASAPLQRTRPAIAFRRDEHYYTLGSVRNGDVIMNSSKVGAEVMAIACFREDTSIAVKSLEGKVFIDRSRLEGQRTVEKEIQVQIHDIKSISLQVLNALACLHSNLIIRRDIKPINILVGQRSPKIKIKVTDYGYSSLATPPDSSVGSHPFIAPEVYDVILRGGCYDGKVDVYSLALTMLALLGVSLPEISIRTEEDWHFCIKGRVASELCSECNSERKKALSTALIMAAFDPEMRPSVAECYKLPWFDGSDSGLAFEILGIGLQLRERSPLFMFVDNLTQTLPEQQPNRSQEQSTLASQQCSDVQTWPEMVKQSRQARKNLELANQQCSDVQTWMATVKRSRQARKALELKNMANANKKRQSRNEQQVVHTGRVEKHQKRRGSDQPSVRLKALGNALLEAGAKC